MYLLKKFLLNENKDQIMLLKTKSKSQNQMCSMIPFIITKLYV